MTISQTNWNEPAYLVNLFKETGHRSVLMVLKFWAMYYFYELGYYYYNLVPCNKQLLSVLWDKEEEEKRKSAKHIGQKISII